MDYNQQEYTTHQVSSSRGLDSIQQEDNVVTYDLTEKELFNLLKNNIYEDLVLVSEDEYSAVDCFSHNHGIYVELKCRRKHYDELLIEKLKYDRLVAEANKIGMMPVYICHTPLGIWEFNLDLLNIKWEDRDDLPATTDFEDKRRVTKTVGYLSINKGKPLLPWYPEYPSEDEFIMSSLGEFGEDDWVDPAELDIENWFDEENYN